MIERHVHEGAWTLKGIGILAWQKEAFSVDSIQYRYQS